MRFRTQIINVPLLHKIVRSLAALARQCIVRLSPDKVHFIVPGNEGRDGVQVWSQVKVRTLFKDYKIESNNDNEIWLEVNLESLLKVLKSADSSAGNMTDSSRNATMLADPEVSLRLNKKNSQAVWDFEIRGKSLNQKTMTISHQVFVHVLSQRRQAELNEPLCPPPDIHLVLPNLGDLRNIVSRLSHVADDVMISANLEGTMELAVKDKSGRVNLTTTWKELHIPSSTADQDGDVDPLPSRNRMFSTLVSIRGLLKFLTSHLVGGVTIACICENHCVIAYVYIGEINEAGGVLTFFIPAKNTGDF